MTTPPKRALWKSILAGVAIFFGALFLITAFVHPTVRSFFGALLISLALILPGVRYFYQVKYNVGTKWIGVAGASLVLLVAGIFVYPPEDDAEQQTAVTISSTEQAPEASSSVAPSSPSTSSSTASSTSNEPKSSNSLDRDKDSSKDHKSTGTEPTHGSHDGTTAKQEPQQGQLNNEQAPAPAPAGAGQASNQEPAAPAPEPEVTTPVEQPAPNIPAVQPTETEQPQVANFVHPGAWCSTPGATGQSKTGIAMVCSPVGDGKGRWRAQ